jgi:flagellar motor switch protein FliG
VNEVNIMNSVKKREDFRSLTGPEKAAMLMLAVGEEHCARLFQMMDNDEIREISQHIANLGTINAVMMEKLFAEFMEKFSTTGTLIGNFENAERLLSRVLDPNRVSLIMEEIRGPAGRTMWDKLGNVSENVLANYLKNEYPQTVAVVLSKIKPDHAARVLALMPEPYSMEVIQRMLRMESVQKDVINDIERTLRTEFMSNLARTQRRDPHEMMAEIFNGFDRNTEQRFIAALEDNDAEAAERIKALMFTFEDMKRLDANGIQAVLRIADKDKIGIALKGAGDGIKELFFSNMSERAAKILREDMESMGPVKVRDVEDAQSYLVLIAKDLADKGEIEIADAKGGEDLVY